MPKLTGDEVFTYNGKEATDEELILCAKLLLKFEKIFGFNPGCDDQQIWECTKG